MQILSPSPIIRQALCSIEHTIIQYGGTIHPNLCVHHSNETLWISCPANADNIPLLVIPDSLFIPVTQLEWISDHGTLAYKGETAGLTQEQIVLLNAMLALYNATDKLEKFAERMPAQLLPKDPALFDWLMEVRPAFALPEMNAASQFIQTRLNTNNDDGAENPTGYLMPLIDLLNHHPYGPKYQRTENNDWRIPVGNPNPLSDECFVRYNKSDSLSLAIWHNYFESKSQHVAALDCVLQHPNIGEVRIKGTNARRRELNAPRIIPDETLLTMQDIVLEAKQLPALRTLTGLAVRSKRRQLTQAQAETEAELLIRLLIDENIRKYTELAEMCIHASGRFALRPMLGNVAEHQLHLLRTMQSSK